MLFPNWGQHQCLAGRYGCHVTAASKAVAPAIPQKKRLGGWIGRSFFIITGNQTWLAGKSLVDGRRLIRLGTHVLGKLGFGGAGIWRYMVMWCPHQFQASGSQDLRSPATPVYCAISYVWSIGYYDMMVHHWIWAPFLDSPRKIQLRSWGIAGCNNPSKSHEVQIRSFHSMHAWFDWFGGREDAVLEHSLPSATMLQFNVLQSIDVFFLQDGIISWEFKRSPLGLHPI